MNPKQFLSKTPQHPPDQKEEAKQERREDRVDAKRERNEEFDFERDQGARP